MSTPSPEIGTEIPTVKNPIAFFETWLKLAEESEPNDPNAMNIATVNAQGHPSSRMVLLKGIDTGDDTGNHGGFIFYTNKTSHKAADITANNNVALNFHWKSLRKQVRVEGAITNVSSAESDAYFASRSRKSQLGAWASNQSSFLENRAIFEEAYHQAEARFNGQDVPRPEHWGGYKVTPRLIEFWQDMPYRLHDRLVYEWDVSGWKNYRLYP